MKAIRLALCALMISPAAALSAQADDVKSSEPRVVRGKLIEVRPAERTLVVSPRQGESVKLIVDEKSQLQERDGEVKLNQLKEGKRVRVTYVTKDGANRVVLLQEGLLSLERVQQFLTGALGSAKTYAYSQRDEYRRKLESGLREVDERIADLEERAEDAGAEARRRLEQEMPALREKQRELRTQLDRVRNATADTWSEIQAGARAVAEDIERTIERIRQRTATEPKQ
jgi:hypothetical protein